MLLFKAHAIAMQACCHTCDRYLYHLYVVCSSRDPHIQFGVLPSENSNFTHIILHTESHLEAYLV